MKNIFKKLFVITLVLFTVTACGKETKKEKKEVNKFKSEYEVLNKTKNPNNDKTYPSITISENNPVVYSNGKEIVDIIKNKTGIIYLGYPECPWCRNAVPVLLEAAKQTGIKKIYYLNMHDIRDKKSLDDDGNIVVEEEGTKEYKDILEALGDKASVYQGLNDDSIRRIYVPLIIFVKDGEILYTHEGTVESQEDPYVKLNDEQTKELLEIFKENIHKVLDDLCDSSC